MNTLLSAHIASKPKLTRVQSVYMAIFALNAGFTIMVLTLGLGIDSPLVAWLYRADSDFRQFLRSGAAGSDLAGSSYAFLIFGLGLAGCFWAALSLSSRTYLTRVVILQWAGGFISLGSLPAVAINPFSNENLSRKVLFPLELLLVLFFAFEYLFRRWPRSVRWIVVLCCFHFVFWSSELGPNPQAIETMLLHWPQFHAWYLLVLDNASIAWTTAFCSAVAWAFYVKQTQFEN